MMERRIKHQSGEREAIRLSFTDFDASFYIEQAEVEEDVLIVIEV